MNTLPVVRSVVEAHEQVGPGLGRLPLVGRDARGLRAVRPLLQGAAAAAAELLEVEVVEDDDAGQEHDHRDVVDGDEQCCGESEGVMMGLEESECSVEVQATMMFLLTLMTF